MPPFGSCVRGKRWTNFDNHENCVIGKQCWWNLLFCLEFEVINTLSCAEMSKHNATNGIFDRFEAKNPSEVGFMVEKQPTKPIKSHRANDKNSNKWMCASSLRLWPSSNIHAHDDTKICCRKRIILMKAFNQHKRLDSNETFTKKNY